MKVLLVGGGGREHALAWRLAQSDQCDELYCAPGNPGIEEVAECISIAADDVELITKFAVEKGIDLVVAGPEAPLVAGLADRLKPENIPIFGASKAAAQLEGSKGFTKDLCRKYNIPTAAYERFTDIEKAKGFVRKTGTPIVIKADGLAAGKGVIIAQDENEAFSAIEDMLSGNLFGSAGASIVIEEFLDGEELSFFALSDGNTVLPFTSAQDHKRVGDGDVGPNTGGMGAYSPAHLLTPDLQEKIMSRIILPTAEGMKKDGHPFQGIFFAGIMIVKNDPYLIEYNVRFGDPECQPIMMRLETDLLEILYSCAKGELKKFDGKIEWSNDVALAVVMAAKGYPGSYAKGGTIRGIEEADQLEDVKVFHAGTSKNEQGDIISTGGRVLGVTALGSTVKESQAKAYEAVDLIDWNDGFCRRDIGWRAVKAA